jgi:hypothetical protein
MTRRSFDGAAKMVTVHLTIHHRQHQWLVDHHISRSALFRSAIDDRMRGDSDYKAKELLGEFTRLSIRIDEIKDEILRLTGKPIDAHQTADTCIDNPDIPKVKVLYDALSPDQKQMLDDPSKLHFIESWLETRAGDYGLSHLPPDHLIELLKEGA